MKTNYQNASMLDMIFENRNKNYGAYVLRRDYNQSVSRAILVMITSVFLLGFGKFISDKLSGTVSVREKSDITLKLSDIVMPKIEEKLEFEPPKPPHSTASQAIQTQQNTEMNVIADNSKASDSIPTNEQIQHIDPGIATSLTGNTIGVTDGTGTEPTINPVPEPVVTDQVFTIVSNMPKYPGGEEALMKFLAKNTEYPPALVDIGIEGKVLSQFTVDESGRVTDVRIIKSPNSFFDKEVIRVVKMLPNFSPGTQQGRPVKVRLTLPFTFTSRN